jgi:hypothetical protein
LPWLLRIRKGKQSMNQETLDMMAKIAEAAAHQTRDGIVDMLTHLAKKSLMDPDIPNYVANTLVATIATIKEVDVANFFTVDDE